MISTILAVIKEDSKENIIKSLDSLLSQTYKDLEILICANFVSKESKEILTKYETENKGRIRVFETSRDSSRGGAYNLGLLNTEADYVCFLSAGDTLESGFMETLMKKAKENNADVVSSGYKTAGSATDTSDSSIINQPDEDVDYAIESDILKEAVGELDYDKHALLAINPGRMQSKIFKREIFDKNGLWFPEEVMFESMGIQRLALLCAKHFEFVEDRLCTINTDNDSFDPEVDLYERLDVMSFFLEETYKREFLEEYPEEIECAVVDDMYIKTLFKYIAGSPNKKPDAAFIRLLQESILDCFPEFETNPYYYEKYDDDIKELISLHISNPNKFIKQIAKMKK